MIRINLLGADRAPGKKRAAPVAAAAAAPGTFQAYLFLALFLGGTIFLCAAAWWFKSAQIKDLENQTAAAEYAHSIQSHRSSDPAWPPHSAASRYWIAMLRAEWAAT